MEKRIVALIFGIICHCSFALGVALMMRSIEFGLDTNFFHLHSWSAVIWDLFLVLQFPILHTFFLLPKGRKLLSLLAPSEIRSDMGTTLYAFFASLQLILVFGLWAGSGRIIWQPSSQSIWYLFSIAYGVSWLLLLKAMADAGLSIQTGFLGWSAVFRGKKPVYKKFCTTGLNRFTRNPIYLSFALILWTAPVWTWDRVLLVVPWTLYCIVGPFFKEARYKKCFGDEYLRYQERVPYWVPGMKFR